MTCSHLLPPGHCIQCDARLHIVLKCASCSLTGGQTWHVIEGGEAACRKCGTKRNPAPNAEDIGITS